jgi:hypothetical protein
MMAAKVIHSSASCTGHHDDDDSCCAAARDVGNSTALYQNLRISDWSASLKSLKENPLEASIWIICSHKDVRSIPTATMMVPSSSLDHQAEWKMLPLHAAILYGAPSYVTSEILSAYPNAAREKDLKGRLPIHLAASVGAIVSSSSAAEDGQRIVTDLVRVYPEALWVPDESGRTAMELVQILQMQNNNDGGGSSAGQQSQQQQQRQQQQPQQQQPQQEDCKLKQPAKQQTSQQQPQEDYKSLYDLLSQGMIAPDISIPNAVSTESSDSSSSTSSMKKTMNKMFSRKDVTVMSNHHHQQGSVDGDKPVIQQSRSFELNMKKTLSRKNNNGKSYHKLGPELPEEQEERGVFVLGSDRDDALVRCDDVVCYDEITYGYSGSMDKEEEEEEEEEQDVMTKVTNISKSAESATDDKMEEEKERTSKRPPTYLGGVFNNSSRSKRTKKAPLMDLMCSIGGSMSFDSIVSSYSKEKKERRHVLPTKCDCEMCETAEEITKEMGDIKRTLLASDLERPTLLFDYLVASDWDNVMSRIRVAPSEVKAWARKEVHGEMVLDVLPLHAAIVLGAPSDLIIALLNTFPTGAGEIDGNRSFPIHLVASCFTCIGRGDLIVDHLLKAFRSGKQAVDAKGRTPSDIISIMSTYREHCKGHTSCEAKLATASHESSESNNITLTKTFEDDAAFAYLIEKAMTNLQMPLKYQHTFLRQASIQGIETIDDLVMADDEFLDTIFSEKELTAELRRLLSLFIEGGGG